MDKQEILSFIDGFNRYGDQIEDLFLNGYCFYFAIILKNRFPGQIFYDPVEGHFVTLIGDDFYDITGCVTSEYDRDLYDESVWSTIPSIIHGCILKDNWSF